MKEIIHVRVREEEDIRFIYHYLLNIQYYTKYPDEEQKALQRYLDRTKQTMTIYKTPSSYEFLDPNLHIVISDIKQMINGIGPYPAYAITPYYVEDNLSFYNVPTTTSNTLIIATVTDKTTKLDVATSRGRLYTDFLKGLMVEFCSDRVPYVLVAYHAAPDEDATVMLEYFEKYKMLKIDGM